MKLNDIVNLASKLIEKCEDQKENYLDLFVTISKTIHDNQITYKDMAKEKINSIKIDITNVCSQIADILVYSTVLLYNHFAYQIFDAVNVTNFDDINTIDFDNIETGLLFINIVLGELYSMSHYAYERDLDIYIKQFTILFESILATYRVMKKKYTPYYEPEPFDLLIIQSIIKITNFKVSQ